jgi:hypothetical protein
MGGERTERRTAIMAVAKVAWKDQNGTAREISVKIEDTSRSGACIRISVPISVESKLIVDWREGRFSGVAKYCRADGDEYNVGIRRDAPEIAAQAQVSTEVTTGGTELGTSENVREALADPEQIETVLLTRDAPQETVMSSAVMHRGATHEINVDYKTESPSDLDVWHVKQRDMSRFAERQPDQPSHREERSTMLSKWLKSSPKHDRKDVPDGNSNRARGSNSGAHAQTEVSGDMYGRPSRKGLAIPQGDLLPLEDVYRATGILDARAGYNVLKVVEMLGSSHIRELPDELRRASVLMALDTAGISVEEILKDARLRLEALASYEADQEKRLKECESRKLRENAEIQLEMEKLTEHYLERMNRNLDEVSVERNPFIDWQAMKQQEVQRISEAVGLCEKRAISKTPNSTAAPSQLEAGVDVAAPEPPESSAKHGAPAAGKGPRQADTRTVDA